MTPSGVAHPERPKGCVAMFSISTPKRSTRFAVVAAAGVVLFGLLSPATASDQTSPDVLTSHKPWLPPTGPRQPTRADVAQHGGRPALAQENTVPDSARDQKQISRRAC